VVQDDLGNFNLERFENLAAPNGTTEQELLFYGLHFLSLMPQFRRVTSVIDYHRYTILI
jgi:hypothetical protein